MARIIPSITTHGYASSSWKDKIQEIPLLKLNEVALFTTGLAPHERKECYALLEAVKNNHPFTIPFVHAVSSMSESEYEYLIDTFGVQYFNLHPVWQFPLEHSLSKKIREKILIENSFSEMPLSKKDIEGFRGICFDISHVEDLRKNNLDHYHQLMNLPEAIPVFANHISGAKEHAVRSNGSHDFFSVHVADSKEDFHYIRNLDPVCFATLCAIELENSLSEQVTFIPYIESLMNLVEEESRQKVAA